MRLYDLHWVSDKARFEHVYRNLATFKRREFVDQPNEQQLVIPLVTGRMSH
jgi:hypothetical protein